MLQIHRSSELAHRPSLTESQEIPNEGRTLDRRRRDGRTRGGTEQRRANKQSVRQARRGQKGKEGAIARRVRTWVRVRVPRQKSVGGGEVDGGWFLSCRVLEQTGQGRVCVCIADLQGVSSKVSRETNASQTLRPSFLPWNLLPGPGSQTFGVGAWP